MKGPFKLSELTVSDTPIKPGVYILSRGGTSFSYVGRSDTDVIKRILQSKNEGKGYTHFYYEFSTSPMQAYLAECRYYHLYNPPDNTIHPAVPAGCNWRCPVQRCYWS
jgi:hypothetical protein